MFVSLAAEVEILQETVIPLAHGEAMHAEFLRRVANLDPAVATHLHGEADGRPRPYTLSGLQVEQPVVRDGRVSLRTGDRAWFRLTAMGELPCQALLAMSESTDRWLIRGRGFESEAHVRRWCAHAEEHPWAGMVSTKELQESAWAAAESEPKGSLLVFHSATAFEESDKGWASGMPLPVPRLVFGSLRRRALECTSFGEPANAAELIERHIALGRFGPLLSQILFFEKHRFQRSGFTGECEFRFDRELPEPIRVWFHLLANLAFYSGVGRETSWGMGQIRREPEDKFSYRGP